MKINNLKTFPKIIIDEMLSFVITENCSFQCAHCMRGDRSPRTITKEVIDAVLASVQIDGELHITGGEALLQSSLVAYLLNEVYRLGNRPESVEIITNGSVGKEKFEEAIEPIKRLETKLQFLISDDIYHKAERERLGITNEILTERLKDYQKVFHKYGLNDKAKGDYKWMLGKKNGHDLMYVVSAIGKGVNIAGSMPKWREFSLTEGKLGALIIGNTLYGQIQVQTDGRITRMEDMSWEEIDTHYGEDHNILKYSFDEIITNSKRKNK